MKNLETEKVCIYYGDCSYNFRACQEDEPWFICPKYQPSLESEKILYLLQKKKGKDLESL